MADQKITQLTADTSPTTDDILAVVNDPSGTPATKKVTIAALLSLLCPIGTIREFNVSTNPATLLGFGTWSAYGTGRVTVAIDAGQTEFDVVDETGGAKTHTLAITELPAHTHNTLFKARNASGVTAGGDLMASDASDASKVGSSTGSGAAHNNLQPYIVVYRWVRTA